MKISRLAIVVSHPIQRFCPQYTSWAKLPNVDLKVFFASKHGLLPYKDKGFDRIVQWPSISLDFPHIFLLGAEENAIGASTDSTELNDQLTAFSPEIVLVYGYSQKLQKRALRWANSKKIPVIMISDSELHAKRAWFKQLAKEIVIPPIFKRVSLFLTVGDANEAYYRNYCATDNHVSRCSFPIDICSYDSVLSVRSKCRDDIRVALNIPNHHKIILHVGKLVSLKRQVDLIRFSNSIQAVRDDLTVVLVGTGQDESKLRAETRHIGAGGVVFAGFVTPEILAKYYCAADIYVHCSEREAHSLAISEAIYCGLPVVISDRCGSYGPMDDVRVGLNGLVYRCGDVADLTRRLMYVLNEPDVYALMSSASTRLGHEHQALAHGMALRQALTVINS